MTLNKRTFLLVGEPEDTPLVILEEETVDPASVLPSVPVEELFSQGFEGCSDEDFNFSIEEQPLTALPLTRSTPVANSQGEVGPSNKGKTKQEVIEVPDSVNLLKKPDRAVVHFNYPSK